MDTLTLKWGTCHVEIYQDLLAKILTNINLKNEVNVLKASATGAFDETKKNEIFYTELSSCFLPPGYHGVCNFILIDNVTHSIKKDMDT